MSEQELPHPQPLSKRKLAEYRKLKLRKYRQKSNFVLLEGRKILLEFLQNNNRINTFLFSAAAWAKLGWVEQKAIFKSSYLLNPQQVAALSDLKNPDGFFFLLDKRQYQLGKTVEQITDGAWFFLDRLQDPGNLGTIVRLAAAFSFKGVLSTEGTIDLFHPKVLRAASGSFHYLKYCSTCSYEDLPIFLANGFKIVAGSPGMGTTIDEYQFTARQIIILGNEGRGVAKNLDIQYLRIPHSKKVDSLNVGIAAGIMAQKYFLDVWGTKPDA
ncbi:TrmH family RNA methyltransferase [Candidatus Riflebacteria bacterium]